MIEIPKRSTIEYEDNELGRQAKAKADAKEARMSRFKQMKADGKSSSNFGFFGQRLPMTPDVEPPSVMEEKSRAPMAKKELKSEFPEECVRRVLPKEAKVDDGMIAILGSNPTAICAAHRLLELGHNNFKLFPSKEKSLAEVTSR